jgi:hypothetical protein
MSHIEPSVKSPRPTGAFDLAAPLPPVQVSQSMHLPNEWFLQKRNWGILSGMADESLHEYKMQFARLLQRSDKSQRLHVAHSVAKELVGRENAVKYTQYVLQMGDEWPHDPVVIEEMDRLDAIPKSKERYLEEIWSIAGSANYEAKDRNNALRLYGLAMKYIGPAPEDVEEANKSLGGFQQMIDAIVNPKKT